MDSETMWVQTGEGANRNLDVGGLHPQKRFFGDALTNDIDRYMQFSANADTSLVIELLQEMYSGNQTVSFQARKRLWEQSVQLVGEHWNAIDTRQNPS